MILSSIASGMVLLSAFQMIPSARNVETPGITPVIQFRFKIVQNIDGFEIIPRLSADEPTFDDGTPLVMGAHIHIDSSVVHVFEHRLGDGS